MSSHEGRARVRAALPRHWPMLALSVLVVAAAVGLHRTGHAWGDDFTLYLRQGQSLLDGNIGQVVADNHFNVDNGARPGFSPYVYPWGFPMLMAPFLRMFGLDFAKLKLVEVACFVVFLWGFHAVVRRRMHRWLAFATVASVGTTLAYLVHTDKLVSEFPYMAGVGLTLWWLDRLRHEQPLDAASRGQLVTLGLMAMCVFNVRREGLALIAAIAVAQLLDLRGRWRAADRRQVATPFVTFLGSAVLAQLLLPSAIAPEYADAGLHQTWSKLQGPFRTAFADQLGFSWLAGVRLLLVSLVVVAGVAIRLWRRPATDAPLVVFAVGSMLLVGMIPAIADRYLLGVTPFAVYFAAQAVAAIPLPRQLASRQAGAWLATATLAGISLLHVVDLSSAVGDARAFNDSGKVQDGPEAPYAQAAFTAIRTYTHQDDVVAFFKVRSLTFYTGRRGVQSDDLTIVRQRADYFMMRRNSTYSQPLVTDRAAAEMGWTEVWSDDSWVLWRVPLYESG
ncbi:MAG: hypothetical protein IPP16_01785 [Acidimicrobiaceae bacterium]|nr:hypothetical protein [Acidimicrobiaceae bacterium]